VLHSVRSKLFVMQDGAWVERGTGLLKLNATKDGDKTGARLGELSPPFPSSPLVADTLHLLQSCAPTLPTACSSTRPSSQSLSSRPTKRNTSASPSLRVPSLSATCYGCVSILLRCSPPSLTSSRRHSSPGPPMRRTSCKPLEIVSPYFERPLSSLTFFLSWSFGRPFAVVDLPPSTFLSSSSTRSHPFRLPLFVALICKESRPL
jgi:hypothetical protein